jgi:hypothetical protein
MLEVRGSDEDLTAFCDYESLSIRAGTQMSGIRTIDIISDENRSDWSAEEIYLSTEVEGLEEFRANNAKCAATIYMTIEAKLPSLAWEELWSS